MSLSLVTETYIVAISMITWCIVIGATVLGPVILCGGCSNPECLEMERYQSLWSDASKVEVVEVGDVTLSFDNDRNMILKRLS